MGHATTLRAGQRQVLNAGAREWTRYRRIEGAEAMGAHFLKHVYDRHSHDAYSFGVTEDGAQAFRCRGAARVSTAGLVMAFNPDDPHDGHTGSPTGFTYRMVYVDPEHVRATLREAGYTNGLPLFAEPVIHDRVLEERIRWAANAILDGTDSLAMQESLDAMLLSAVERHARPKLSTRDHQGGAELVRELMHDRYAEQIQPDEIASVTAGRSRFQVYRAFRARYGLPPSAYLRQLRLREARRLLAAGVPPARAAIQAGFADQAHLTRWFRRTYGVTPAIYQRADA